MNPKQPEKAGPGEESVWDYPRPPKLEPVRETLKIILNGKTLALTNQGFRMLETSHPPVYYLPASDVAMGFLQKNEASTNCEFKGRASYFDASVEGKVVKSVAWMYESSPKFPQIEGFLAFYASKVDECYVGDEKVQSQEGDFYGGWITSKIKGPFKGGMGTWGW